MVFLQRLYPLFLILLNFIPTAYAEWLSDKQAIMGTDVRVEVWHEEVGEGRVAIEAVMAEMRRIDRLMSPYLNESELSNINRHGADAPVPISGELFDLIARSVAFSEMTHGAFDITFASVGHLYNYRRKIKPSEGMLQAALPGIDYRHLLLSKGSNTIKFAKPGIRIDLGGIAKGYAVDRSIAILQRWGIRHALVTAGGDSRLLGDKKGRPWMVGIRDPRSEGKVIAMISLVGTSISTSGDYERYFETGGKRYHHIINPRSGRSVNGIRSVTVIGPDATTTDALSTSVFVMGVKKGMQLVDSLPRIDAVIIDAQGRMHYSAGLLQPGSGQPIRPKMD